MAFTVQYYNRVGFPTGLTVTQVTEASNRVYVQDVTGIQNGDSFTVGGLGVQLTVNYVHTSLNIIFVYEDLAALGVPSADLVGETVDYFGTVDPAYKPATTTLKSDAVGTDTYISLALDGHVDGLLATVFKDPTYLDIGNGIVVKGSATQMSDETLGRFYPDYTLSSYSAFAGLTAGATITTVTQAEYDAYVKSEFKDSLYIDAVDNTNNRLTVLSSSNLTVQDILTDHVFPDDTFTIQGVDLTVFTVETDSDNAITGYIYPVESLSAYTITLGSYLTFVPPAGITLTVPDPIDNSNVLNVPISGNVPGAQVGEYVGVLAEDGLGGTWSWNTSLDGTGDFATSLYLKDLADATITFTVTHYTDNTLTTVIDSATFTTTQLVDPDITLSVTMPVVDENNVSATIITGLMTGQATGTGVNVDVSDDLGGTISGSTTIAADGTYSVTLDLSTLEDGGMMAYAEHADQSLMTATDTNVKSAQPGNPGTISVTLPVVDENNELAVTVSGTTTNVPQGNVVSITVTDDLAATVTASPTVGADGTYSATLDLSTLSDGGLTADVSVEDETLATVTASDTSTKDTYIEQPGSITVSLPSVDENNVAAVVVQGTSTYVPEGNVVSITITDSVAATVTASPTVGADGTYSATMDLSTLAEGNLTADVSAQDETLATITASDTALKDTLDPGTISVSLASVTAENETTVPVSGTSSNVPEGNTVSLTVTDESLATVTGSALVGADGSYSTTLDLSSLAEGALTIDAEVVDEEGTTKTASNTSTKDTIDPIEANVAYHRSAFSVAVRKTRSATGFGTGDVTVYEYTHPETGIPFQVLRWYNPKTMLSHYKLRVLAGFAVTRPQAAVIVKP